MKISTISKRIAKLSINAQQLYLLLFSAYLLASFIATTAFMQYFTYNSINHFIYVIAIGVLVKIFLMDGLSFWQLVIESFFLFLAFISWRSSHLNQIFLMTVFILGARNVSFKRIIKLYFYISCIALTCIITYALLGIIANYTFHQQGRSIRYALGIIYPTDLSAHVLFIMLAHCYLHFEKINIRYYLGYSLISVVMLVVTNGRLSFICECLMILSCLIAKAATRGYTLSRMVAVCYWMFTPICALTIWLMSYTFSPHSVLLSRINTALSGRLSLGHQALHNGVTFFGKYIKENGFGGATGVKLFKNYSIQKYFFIDSSYLRLFVLYGLLMTVVFIVIMTIIGINATWYRNYGLLIAVFVLSVNCMFEQHLLEIAYNPFLLSLISIVNESNHLEVKDEKVQS